MPDKSTALVALACRNWPNGSAHSARDAVHRVRSRFGRLTRAGDVQIPIFEIAAVIDQIPRKYMLAEHTEASRAALLHRTLLGRCGTCEGSDVARQASTTDGKDIAAESRYNAWANAIQPISRQRVDRLGQTEI